MSKSRHGRDKEFSREQKLIHENKTLKKQVSSLRKQLARIDLDRYSHVKDMLEEHMVQDEQKDSEAALEKMKQEWKCRECSNGYLEIFLYNKLNKTSYFRRCTHCSHRTKSQIWTPSVRGIVKKTEEEGN